MMRKITAIILLCLSIHRSAAQSEEFFNTTPHPIKSNFSCAGRITGYYADLPSRCRVYHICDDQGNKFSYYCPEMTLFRQEALICDHAHLVDCDTGTQVRDINQRNLKISQMTTAQSVGRWTTANPFFENLRRDALRPRPSNDTESRNFFSVRFSDSSQTTSGFRNNRKWNENSAQDSGSKSTGLRTDNKETRFNGNVFGGFPKTGGISSSTKTREDNRGESPTSYSGFGQTQTTKSLFSNSKNGDYRWSDNKADDKSSRNPGSKSTEKTTKATIFTSSTEIPFRDFTASLKPLVPNALEYDPYYPRESSSSTEAYYTPSERFKLHRALEAPNFEPSRFGVYFKIPDVWPDLNTIDDIVDRRKLFFIPNSTSDEIF